MTEPKIIMAREVMKVIAPLIGIEVNRVRRIVIDLDMNKVPLIYVELIGDERLLNIRWDNVQFKVELDESEQVGR